VILDVPRFIAAERSYWSELEALLGRLETDTGARLSASEIERLHYLYQRAAADLARVATFSAEPALRQTLEALVSRAYSEVHAQGASRRRIAVREWLMRRCPAAFRARARAFALSAAIVFGGAAFGAAAIAADRDAKWVIMPFPHLRGDPSRRVAAEEANPSRVRGHEAAFAAELMTHNICVSLFAFALGVTFGVGTIVVLFYNGVMLGAVAADYVQAGQTQFLLGWLLPHGAVEIPAILIGGQAGLVLASVLIGPGRSRAVRLRLTGPDIFALLTLLAVLLVWAGIVEAFLSQYHAPVIPYALKISFGVVELIALAAYLWYSGRSETAQ
jgi:uncharacterized membrane protein SpoIIM required for sporulation